ncbi:MAG: superoxide dismutase family protein [bacterium]
MKRWNVIKVIMMISFLVFGVTYAQDEPYSKQEGNQQESMQQAGDTLTAMADLTPAKDNDISGTVKFKQEKEGVRVIVDLENVSPGEHAIFISESGECGSSQGEMEQGQHQEGQHQEDQGMGGEYETDQQAQAQQKRQVLIESFIANPEGTAHIEKLVTDWNISEETEEGKNLVGKSIIISADASDQVDPGTGNSVVELACGVIKEEEQN